MRPKLTLILDRSAFHDGFAALQESHLLNLTRRGIVVVHHTPVFLEETVSMYEKERNIPRLREQLPFIFKVCNGHFLREATEVWHEELVQGRGQLARAHHTPRERREIEAIILEGAYRDGTWTEFLDALADKHDAREKQLRIRAFHRRMREESIVRGAGYLTTDGPNISTDEDIDRAATILAPMLMRRFLGKSRAEALYGMWRRDRARFPFFDAYVTGITYGLWHASNELDQRIDTNAHADIELLCGLHRADAVITHDTRFLRHAFERIWRRKGKRIYTVPELVEYLKVLA